MMEAVTYNPWSAAWGCLVNDEAIAFYKSRALDDVDEVLNAVEVAIAMIQFVYGLGELAFYAGKAAGELHYKAVETAVDAVNGVLWVLRCEQSQGSGNPPVSDDAPVEQGEVAGERPEIDDVSQGDGHHLEIAVLMQTTNRELRRLVRQRTGVNVSSRVCKQELIEMLS